MTIAYVYEVSSDDDTDALTPHAIVNELDALDVDTSALRDCTNDMHDDKSAYLFDNSTRAQFTIFCSDDEKLYFVPRHMTTVKSEEPDTTRVIDIFNDILANKLLDDRSEYTSEDLEKAYSLSYVNAQSLHGLIKFVCNSSLPDNITTFNIITSAPKE